MKKSGFANVAARGGGTVIPLPSRGVAASKQNPAGGLPASPDTLAAVLCLTIGADDGDAVGNEDPIVCRDDRRGGNRRKFDYTGFCSGRAVLAALTVVSAAVARRAAPSRREVNHHMIGTARTTTTPALGGHLGPRDPIVRGAC
ncbi:hypothetical protein [Rhodococcus koreensis]